MTGSCGAQCVHSVSTFLATIRKTGQKPGPAQSGPRKHRSPTPDSDERSSNFSAGLVTPEPPSP